MPLGVTGKNKYSTCVSDGIAQSEQRFARGWTVRGSNPGGAKSFATFQTGPWAHTAFCTMGIEGLLPGGKAVVAWRCPPTPIWLRDKRKSRAVPLLALRTFMACCRVNFTSLQHVCKFHSNKLYPTSEVSPNLNKSANNFIAVPGYLTTEKA
jgi:hypothetical protein